MSKLKVDTIEVNSANSLQLASNASVIAENGSPRSLTVSGGTTLEGLLTVQGGVSLTGNVAAVSTPNLGTSNAKLGTVHATSIQATAGSFDSLTVSSQTPAVILGSARLKLTSGSGGRRVHVITGTDSGVCLGMDSGTVNSTSLAVPFASPFSDVNDYKAIFTPIVQLSSNSLSPRAGITTFDASQIVIQLGASVFNNFEIGTLVVVKS